ncbi:GNAT family N-acetyltransferase [Bacillus alveayuensis]|uniref:N-acetylglutamate synthase-like GNAT family acetyltransferase n=1 Tax=Aeribacillus alveayuensis TaxID=279215 RepID=A0ABT9VNR6_9BACI|nr:hypothetical protein [Bacillus alveayuensis]MDQ0162623.1 N-acetylglutamate synthase-like GNAT family acetyltransferase [Bacillus alveayuensis]
MFYSLRMAERKDLEVMKQFVGKAGISTEGFEQIIDQFVLLESDEQNIVGCLGMELIGQDGLLRSLVISDQLNQAHLAALLKSIDALKERKKVRSVYLMTNKQTSIEFLEILGFRQINVDQLPEHLSNCQHVKQTLQSDHATFMVK